MPPKQKKVAETAQASQEDVSMTDAPPVAAEHLLPSLEEQRIRIVTSPKSSFIAKEERLG
jgi:hypothetical protein